MSTSVPETLAGLIRNVFLFYYGYRYMTALTDSDEEDQSEEEETAEEQTAEKLSVLFERIDRLRQGDESDKRETLNILLEQKEEVCLYFSISLTSYMTRVLPKAFIYFCSLDRAQSFYGD